MMHPACLPTTDLLVDCTHTTQKRSGPGGQHRNKVETAVITTHLPSGIQAEACERRSQAENRRVSLVRLRHKLALDFRTTPAAEPSATWCSRRRDGKLLVAAEHADYPSLLAELFDYLAAREYDLSQAALHFGVTASQLIKLVRKHPPALQKLNEQRRQLGLKKLS